MSISNSLVNALSGLNAASRRAEIVSSNVANAGTDGYARRQLELSAASVGGVGTGVMIDGISRTTDIRVIQDRRLADANLANSATRASYFAQLEQITGTPDSPGSFSDRIARLEAALISSASRPDSEARLNNVLFETQGITEHLNAASGKIQSLRQEADANIANDVKTLNTTLQQVKDLNADISATRAAGLSGAGLMDQRQQLIDGISSIVPVQQVPRANGAVALYTTGGAVLLDGFAAQIGFTYTDPITPDMTIDNVLSGLTLNNVPLDTSGDNSLLRGGSLIANFVVRDELAVTAQSEYDAVARNLIERFQNPATDPSLGVSDAGFFTDQGSAFSTLNEEGISGRITVNALVDPAQGGATWRLRDGLGAATPGDIGNSTQIQRFATAIQAPLPVASGAGAGTQKGMTDLVSELLSGFGTARQANEAEMSYYSVQQQSYRVDELSNGVDTDKEMQDLLLIEQAFAANARVIQTADELIQMLTRL